MAEGTDCEGIPSTTNGNAKPIKLFKLVVFGGTGPCGTEVVKQALELGHEVTIVARTPEKFQIKCVLQSKTSFMNIKFVYFQ